MPPGQPSAAEVDAARQAIVQQAVKQIVTPEDIEAVRRAKLNAQSAASAPGYVGDDLPEPTPREIRITDITKRVPDRIFLWMSVITPVTFLDRSGKAWPIERVEYDPRALVLDGVGCVSGGQQQPAQQPAEAKPSTITLSPCAYKTFATILVRLEGLASPITFIVFSGDAGKKIDLPVTVRVVGSSPTTAAQQRDAAVERKAADLRRAYTGATATPRGADPELDAFLSAVPPKGAQSVPTDMRGVQAWLYGGRLYVRGPVSVLNPTYDAMGRDDAQFVYRFASPVARIRVVLDDGVERPVTLGL